MIYLDTCLVIYAVEDTGPRGLAVNEALAAASEQEFVISPLVITECLVGPIKTHDTASRAHYTAFFSALTVVPLGVGAAVRAAELRARHGLKTPDALHLAAAIDSGCDALWTNDRRLQRAAGHFAVNRINPGIG